MSADLSRSNIHGFLAEHVIRADVENAHDRNNDPACNDELPDCCSERLLGRSCFVEVTEDRNTEDDHYDTEGDEAGGGAEEGPVVSYVSAEHANFGDNEGHCIVSLSL